MRKHSWVQCIVVRSRQLVRSPGQGGSGTPMGMVELYSAPSDVVYPDGRSPHPLGGC